MTSYPMPRNVRHMIVSASKACKKDRMVLVMDQYLSTCLVEWVAGWADYLGVWVAVEGDLDEEKTPFIT